MKLMRLIFLFAFCFSLFAQSGGKFMISGAGRVSGQRGSAGGGGSLSVQVLGPSNTQAALAYIPPNSSPCLVKVSQNADLIQLVNDVNPALFTGSNSDDRAGGLSSSTARIFVIGKRMTEAGTGGNFSRALQALTTHYYRVACGAFVGTGSFTTQNIPIGNTANELVHVNPATGSAIVPTFPNDRTTSIIDEQTGALVKRVNLDAEGTGLSLYSGGRIPMCGYQLVGPGPGYLCSFPTFDGSPSPIYYLIPTTGEVKYLGIAYQAGVYAGGGVGSSEVFFDPANTLYFYKTVEDGANTLLIRFEYAGDFGVTAVAPGDWANLTHSYLSGDIKTAFHAYNSAFDVAKFNCDFLIGGAYGVSSCKRGAQDSYGWLFVWRMSDNAVIAGFNIAANPNSRWCGNHSTFIVANTALVGMLTHQFSEGVLGGVSLGLGPYETTLAAGISSGATTITVAGEPQSISDPSIEPYLQDAAVGDWFIVGDTDLVGITGKSGTTWTITQPYTTHAWSSGTAVRAWCKDNPSLPSGIDMWWKFLVDPTATSTGYFGDHYINVGHKDVSPEGQVSERDGVIGPIMSSIDVPVTFSLSLDPTFAGVSGFADGNSMSDYPAYLQLNATTAEKQWFLDEPAFFGAAQMNGGITTVSGQLYKYTPGVWGALHRKHRETLAAMGDRMLTDISSPSTGNIIGTTSAANYTLCVPAANDECRTGSSIGDVYFNVPGLTYTICGGYETGDFHDICITDLPYGQGAYQFGFAANTVGIDPASVAPNYGAGYTRKLSTGFGGIKDLTKKFKPTAAAEWAFLTKGAYWNSGSSMLMLKMLPFPAPDGVDRSTFVRVPVPITVPSGQGIARAALEFGYGEHGTVAQHRCTTRGEPCLAMAATVTDATPFKLAVVEASATASALACTTSCTVMLPLLPLHIAYWQVKFYDAGGSFIQDGPKGIAMESGATTLP